MKRKLKSSRGESIAESLVSILVVALASILFAGMVTASSKVIDQSTDWMARYYAAVSSVNDQTENGDAGGRVKKDDTVKISIQISISGKEPITEDVKAYINDDMGVKIVSYLKK